jgi:Family of unknown function (DUF6092)
VAEVRVEASDLRLSLLEVLTYLAVSAHGVIASSKLYGPLRLMEGCERLIRLMESLGLADPDLRMLADRIVSESMLISTDTDRCRAFTDEASVSLARKLKEASLQADADEAG